MTRKEHLARHMALDEAALELWADFSRHNPRCLPQDTTVGQLLTWSRRELSGPTEGCEDVVHSYAVCAHCGNRVDNPDCHVCDAGEGTAQP